MTLESFKADAKKLEGLKFEKIGKQLRVNIVKNREGLTNDIIEIAYLHDVELDHGEGDFLQFREIRVK